MISELLDKALADVTVLDVEENGTVLDKKETDYIEKYHDADGAGGRWREAVCWLYKNKKYLGVYDCYDFPFRKKTCILFHEVN